MAPASKVTIGFASLVLAAHALAALQGRPSSSVSGRTVGIISDRVLNRQWVVHADAAHPGGPFRMVEAPLPQSVSETTQEQTIRKSAEDALPVRSGQCVLIVGNTLGADVELHGVALADANIGQPVPLRTAFSAQLIQGIVRGRGLVELISQEPVFAGGRIQ